jgi:methionine aminotransferase
MAFSAHTPSQHAFVEILKNEALYLELGAFYQNKRDLFREAITASRFEILPCSGTYFQLLHYGDMSELGDEAYAEYLTKEHKIASVPISVFYLSKRDEHVLRFCFAKEDKTILKAAEILCKI